MTTRRVKARVAAFAAALMMTSVAVLVAPGAAHAETAYVTVNYGDWNCPTGYGGARGVVVRLTGVSIAPPGEVVASVPGRSATLRAFLRQNVTVTASLTCRVKINRWGWTQDYPNVLVNVVRYFQFAGHNMWI